MKLISLVFVSAQSSSFACLARATPYVIASDARPSVVEGRIVTDAYSHEGVLVADVRHFGYTLGASTYFTSDPGFNALAGSGLPVGQQLRFDIVRHLSRWDRNDAVSFTKSPTLESLRFSFGSASAVVSDGTDNVAGFAISNVGSGGALHRHLNATVQPGTLTTPAPGLYFTAIRLAVSGGTIAHSDALYIAYNNGLSTADFSRGMAYLADPTPGDANFDASVDFDDLLVLAQNYAANTDASWFDGDFNRDRQVGFDDLLALAQNYGDAPAFAADWALAQSIVPEPGAMFALGTLIPLSRAPRRAAFR